MKKFLIASVVATVILVGQAQANSNIVFYSFNTNGFTGAAVTAADTNAMLTANVGSSISVFTNVNTAGGRSTLTLLSSTSGNPNNHGFSGGNSVGQNGWNGNNSYFQFTLDATGYQNLVLAWAGNVSTTGPTNTGLWYSTDAGANFTLFTTIASVLNGGATTQDLSSVTALNNNSLNVFRLYGTNATPIAAGGTMKIDNFSIEADVIPEPSTVLLVGMGLVGMLALRRRRK